MFNRRRRAQSNPVSSDAGRGLPLSKLTRTYRKPGRAAAAAPPSSAAATAAAQAFLAKAYADANLSSAAAAAALRSHTRSPVPVGDIQTKRMQRRLSTSSQPGAHAGRGRDEGTQRSNSPGSMTDRTFRTPSPAGGGGAEGRGRPGQEVLPPLPPIPRVYASPAPPVPVRSMRRPSSTELPERVHSPPPNSPGINGVGLDRGPGVLPGQTTKASAMRTSSLADVADHQCGVNRGSVNFSRPMSPFGRPSSPQASPPSSPSGPNSPTEAQKQAPMNMAAISPSEVYAIQHSLQETTDAPVGKNKNRVITSMTEGSHLAVGAVGSKPTGSAVSSSLRSPSASAAPLSPIEEGATGGLHEQPFTVAEDHEGEEIGMQYSLSNGSAIAGKHDVAVEEPMAANPNTIHTTQAKSQQVKSNLTPENVTMPSEARRGSLSPTRSARFSMKSIYEKPSGVRHEPPARAISPVKSAMKHSPSSRGPSPSSAAWDRPGFVASETSDNMSIVSDDGYRRKKSVRVSFESEPTIVGISSTPASSLESSTLLSPQNRESEKKGWFGLGRDKKRPLQSTEDDDALTPRPALPSFGSVRGKKEVSSGGVPAVIFVNSGDEAADAMRAATSATHQENPLGIGPLSIVSSTPPETSTTSNSVITPDVPPLQEAATVPTEKGGAADGRAIVSRLLESEVAQELPESLPFISLQPATPGVGIPGEANELFKETSGSTPFPELSVHETSMFGETVRGQPEPVSSKTTTPSAIGIAEPDLESSASQHGSDTPLVGHVAESLRQQAEDSADEAEDDSGDSVYSDAAEEPEGDGFGSINAIVDSPIATPTRANIQDIPEDEDSMREPEPEEGWDRAQSYWAGLNAGRKARLENEAMPAANSVQRAHGLDQSNGGPAEVKPVGKKTSGVDRKSPAAAQLPRLGTQARNEGNSPPSMKKSMRDPPQQQKSEPVAQLRSSMRPVSYQTTQLRGSMRPNSPAGAQMRSSMRPVPPSTAHQPPVRSSMDQAQPTKSALKQTKPQSPVAVSGSPQPRVTLQKKNRVSANGVSNSEHVRSVSAKPATMPTPKLHRTSSTGSGSSFKRARSIPSNGKRYAMRHSMRGPPTNAKPQPMTTPPSRDFGARSSSPGERRPFSSLGPGLSIRSSMRESSESRRPQSPARSLLGFRKGPKSESNGSAKPTPRFTSRFNDSDDEDAGPNKYRSRFIDSSDEDEPAPLPSDLRPVRGIPRRIDEGDSTELDDSDEEEAAPKVAPMVLFPANGTAVHMPEPINASDRSTVIAPRTVDGEAKKRSFFGSLGRKKDGLKVQKAGTESAARRDTSLERSKMERAAETSSRAPHASPSQTPRAPELQRRNTPQDNNNNNKPLDSWPLPESPTSPASAVAAAKRPLTSDGGRRARPAPPRRISSIDGAVLGRKGKRKKFPMLRKAFGLHD